MNQQLLTTAPAVRETRTEDGLALLDVNRGVCVSINSTGATIWALLKQGATIDQICQQLVTNHEIGLEQASEDVTDFIATLSKHKLLIPAAASSKAPGRFDRLLKLARSITSTDNR